MHAVTSPITKRLIYFKGHIQEPKSLLVCQVCRDHETLSELLPKGQCALRTLMNLSNLRVVRGCLDPHTRRLDLSTSMTGPHHYLGYIRPEGRYIIKIDPKTGLPVYYQTDHPPIYPILIQIPHKNIKTIHHWKWQTGYFGSSTSDSLFPNSGRLLTSLSTIPLELLRQPQLYDLSSFKVELVENHKPWSFRADLVKNIKHAESHDLRVITYHYGQRYVSEYLMKKSLGVFLEYHDFIQAITPLQGCSGWVVVGRICPRRKLQLLAFQIPRGFTLLVYPGAIHGDSNLVGLHAMAMTGNHNAMKTANAVFLGAVKIQVNDHKKIHPPPRLLCTSNQQSLISLHTRANRVKTEIYKTLSPFQRCWWNPIIMGVGYIHHTRA